MKSHTTILGIDPGYDRIGVAVISKDNTTRKDTFVFSTCITTDRKKEISERIFDAGQELLKIIENYNPEICAVEHVFFAKNVKTAVSVAQAIGAFKYIALEQKLKLFEYTPLQIKQSITGYGTAKKEQVMQMLPHLIDIDLVKKKEEAGGSSKGLDDELDALAVALTCSAFL